MTTTTATADEQTPLQGIINDMKGFARQPATPPAMKRFIEDYLIEAILHLDGRVTETEIAVDEDDDDDENEDLIELAVGVRSAVSAVVQVTDAACRAAGWITDAGPTPEMPAEVAVLYAAANEQLAVVGGQVAEILDGVELEETEEEGEAA